MPNQENYVEPITSQENVRPYRVSKSNHSFMYRGDYDVLFGTDERDIVEVWFYGSNGILVNGIKLRPLDEALTISSLIDNVGPQEFVNIDLEIVAERLNLPPGRYSVTVNFLRDEVGSADTYALRILNVSSDRTEIRVKPVEVNATSLTDIYEFVTPSVPKLYAQALLDQLFEKNIDLVDGEQIKEDRILSRMESYSPNVSTKLVNAGGTAVYMLLFNTIRERTYIEAINNLTLDTTNRAVQQVELEDYLSNALEKVMMDMIASFEIDGRFKLT